ncbi:MAG: type II CAAX endopeptidase family protein [Oscillospiraceae bacterium]|nr:type II CAAX endopeptidase family protein [Oscillospiraceae bacterium]MDD3832619.1 type II CAAX endopeptidase family protein [Oscillospiraceae bacterium]MDD4545923.1 type II CAAX endopeptidase family protein [Oscillospiraceae bacterium]
MTGNYMNDWQQNGGYYMPPTRQLRRDSNFVGIAVLTQIILLQLSFVLVIFALWFSGIIEVQNDQFYGLGNIGFLVIYSFAYIIGMGLPAPIIAAISRRKINPFSKLDSAPGEIGFVSVVLVLLAGMAICVFANFITSYITFFLSQFGILPPEMPSYLENNIPSFIMNIIVFAVLPAILEEMVYRGYVLRTLLKYGNGFALVVSSLLFALMHGNLQQIPFAFIVGLACGYLMISTGQIWPAMMLHFLNNFMSTLLQYAGMSLDTEVQSQKMILLVFAFIVMLGLTSLLILFGRSDPIIRLNRSPNSLQLTNGQKASSSLLAPAIIITIAIAIALTILSIIWGG